MLIRTAQKLLVSPKRNLLDVGHAAIKNMLERLSLGDPDVRAVLPNDVEIFRDLEPLLNRMAEFMKEQIDDSHEVAIGICEHYETLQKLASGDMECRASTASPVELISKLGELINLQTDAFRQAIESVHAKERELVSQTRLQRNYRFSAGCNFLLIAIIVVPGTRRWQS
jgi:hypothetical protein